MEHVQLPAEAIVFAPFVRLGVVGGSDENVAPRHRAPLRTATSPARNSASESSGPTERTASDRQWRHATASNQPSDPEAILGDASEMDEAIAAWVGGDRPSSTRPPRPIDDGRWFRTPARIDPASGRQIGNRLSAFDVPPSDHPVAIDPFPMLDPNGAEMARALTPTPQLDIWTQNPTYLTHAAGTPENVAIDEELRTRIDLWRGDVARATTLPQAGPAGYRHDIRQQTLDTRAWLRDRQAFLDRFRGAE